MCTRFFIDKSQEEIAPVIEQAERSALARKFLEAGDPLITNGEIRPTNVTAVIAPDRSGIKSVYPMKWGFTDKNSGNILLNARSESAYCRPTFRELWTSHRCAVPASYYFEWKRYERNGRIKTGEKYAIQPLNSETTWLCGLYRIEAGFPVFVILTKAAVKELFDIHDRMPVILPAERITDWITPASDPDKVMKDVIGEYVTGAVK